MKRSKILSTFLTFLLVFTFYYPSFSIAVKNVIKIDALSYQQGNVNSLLTPTGLSWKEDSTATATWNAVENANYYLVNVYVYDGETLIGSQETGTASTELDLQHEINNQIRMIRLSSVFVKFDVKAMYIDETTGTDISGSVSKLSDSIEYIIDVAVQLDTPTNVQFDENSLMGSWDKVENVDYYHLIIQYRYNDRIYSYDSASSNCTPNNKNPYTCNLSTFIQAGYKNKGFDSTEVKVSYKVMAVSYEKTAVYKSSSYSDWSNEIDYSHIGAARLQTPTNVQLDDDTLKGSWDKVENVDFYHLIIQYRYNDKTYSYDSASSNCTPNNKNPYTCDLSTFIQAGYKNKGFDSTEVKVSYKVMAVAYGANESYTSSVYSDWSNEICYSHEGAIQLPTPTNVQLNESTLKGTWGKVENADYYHVIIQYNNNGAIYSYDSSSSNFTPNSLETFSGNMSTFLRAGYDKKNYGPMPVYVSYKVKAVAYGTNESYTSSDYSEWSSPIIYNPYNSVLVTSLSLSPNKPVVALGRSFYIGKTITPEDAYYKQIKWTTIDPEIVSIDSNGMITGNKVGTTIINAQILNVNQTAEVSVYEIESNFENEDDANTVIEDANDAIENIITNEDTTGLEVENVKNAIDEIEKGAQDGDLFNVDFDYDEKDSTYYLTWLDLLRALFGYHLNLAGGIDAYIELYHFDYQSQKHHIANLTELTNEVDFEFDIPDDLPPVEKGKRREYHLIRHHGDEFEEMNFERKEDKIHTSSDKFSDFILLYDDIDIPVTGMEVNPREVTLSKGTTYDLEVTFTPEDAATEYTSISSNESAVIVEQNRITAVGVGNSIIVFSTGDGKYASMVTVHVVNPLKDISFSSEKDKIVINNSKKLSISLDPIDTTDDKTVKWSSSDSSIVTVESDGTITAHQLGTVTITAKVGMFEKRCEVTVVDKLMGDLSRDGEVSFTDIIVGLRKVFGYIQKNDQDVEVGDFNHNGDLDFTDLIILLRFIFGYITEL